MGSDTARPAMFAIGWRSLLALGLAVLTAYLLAATQYYATILVLAALMLAFSFGAARRLFQRQSAADISAANRTITRLQSGQRQAAQAQDHLRALLDTVSAALLVLAGDGRITSANRAARLLTGGTGPRLSDIAAIGPEAAAVIVRLRPGTRSMVRLADGQQQLVSVGRFAGGGEDLRLVSLQAVVGELDAVQLKAWEDMSRVLTHEIMNSLTPIASLSESLSGMIRQDGASQQSIEAADTIARRSQGLAGFVARYRQMAQMPEPHRQNIALPAFAAEIRGLMKDRLNGIAYRQQVDDICVTADPDLLSQAVINLLHNAVDAVAGTEKPAIALACTREDGTVIISVSDNGDGVPPEHRDDIFVPFFTTKPGGSGIGLGLVRQIALKHGGRVEVQAGTEGGATFRLVLPQ